MIVYLEVPEEGGRWIFPLAGTPPKDGEPAERHREFVAALQDWDHGNNHPNTRNG